MTDYLDILLGETQKKKVNTYKCKKCSSTNVKVWEHQTRSSDEPITIFIRCKECKFTEVEE